MSDQRTAGYTDYAASAPIESRPPATQTDIEFKTVEEHIAFVNQLRADRESHRDRIGQLDQAIGQHIARAGRRLEILMDELRSQP